MAVAKQSTVLMVKQKLDMIKKLAMELGLRYQNVLKFQETKGEIERMQNSYGAVEFNIINTLKCVRLSKSIEKYIQKYSYLRSYMLKFKTL